MSTKHESVGFTGGMVKQSGAPAWTSQRPTRRANGLTLSGVVLTTYVQQGGESPFPEGVDASPVAVYCDVMVYGTAEGIYSTFIKGAAVLGMGMHNGHVWKPRAATVNVTGGALNADILDPRDLDGDHVLIQFLEDNLDKPIITGRLPHPRTALGNEDLPQAGHRMLLKAADGDPDFLKHNGSFYGLDKDGNAILDTTRAHGGSYGSSGEEAPAGDADHGNVNWFVNNKGKVTILGVDKDRGDEKFRMILEDGKLTVQMGSADKSLVLDTASSKFTVKLGGASLEVSDKDGSAVLKMGDGAAEVPIYGPLRDFYSNQVKSAWADVHMHPGGGTLLDSLGIPCSGLTGAPSASAPSWDASIKSTKIKMPAG